MGYRRLRSYSVTNPLLSPRAAHYRPDVDGLRAVAVVAVLVFHLGGGLSGGFVGVDVFFVISGFLITGIVLREVEQGSFSLRRFWTRRLRRIAPAALVTTVVTLLVGLVILMPGDLVPLARATIAQQLMLTNVYEYFNIGYFDTHRPRPLLHMWSLAVEEQFYLLYPLLVARLPIRRPAVTRAFLYCSLVASLGLSIYATSYRSGAAGFFLLPCRAWELLLGGVVAFELPRRPLGPVRSNTLALLGIASIVVPCVLYSESMQFPGLAALPPCLGACMVILAGSHDQTLVGRLLSSRVAVAIGLVSFSLYLWHWPIHVYAQYLAWESFPWWVTFLLYGASFLAAWLSWRWIEIPFRHGMPSIGFKEAFRAVVACALVLSVGCWGIIAGEGLPNRFPRAAERYFRPSEADTRDASFRTMEEERAADLLIRTFDGASARGVPIDCLVWGDSQAVAALGLMGELFEDHGVRGAWACRNAHFPLLSTTRPMQAVQRQSWLKWADEVVGRVRIDGIRHVVLISDWTGVRDAMVDEGSLAERARSAGSSKLTRSLVNTCIALNEAGATVWLIEPQPHQLSDPLRWLVWAASVGQPVPRGVDRAEYVRVQGPVLQSFDVAAAAAVVRVTPAREQWFDAGGMSLIGDAERSYFIDRTHVSAEGMRRVYRRPFEEMVSAISKSLSGQGSASPDAPASDPSR
jgi:peptidoglycan/LPS O-acetylase OafA/YrhL